MKEKEDKWEAIGGKTTQEVEYPGKTTYKIEGLQFNSHYKIELRAHNDIGYSTPAEAIIKTANGVYYYEFSYSFLYFSPPLHPLYNS